MTALQKWITDPTAVAAAQKIQSTETFGRMMDVMREESPLSRNHIPFGATATDFAYAHGMQKGYEYAIKLLKAMAQQAPELPTEPEATFSKANYE